MRAILDIRVQKLFLLAIVLKVGSSAFGWWFRDPWILGLAVPLSVMAIYIALGLNRRDTDVTNEKFADSCYYLGFIFTITSIIFSLLDIPNIGTRIQEIAVRFGAAMMSTVFGLVVRVYLVSFKRDAADALADVESGVIEASQKLREQLLIAFEHLRDFQSEVDNAAKGTVERVNMQVEALSKNHSARLGSFFAELTLRTETLSTQALDEVKSASLRLAGAVDNYSLGMRANLTNIDAKVAAFTDAVTERLKTTTFPDDFFVKTLAEPLAQLTSGTVAIATGVGHAGKEVKASSAVLSTALKALSSKAMTAEASLDRVISLTEQQRAVLDVANGQLSLLEQLRQTLGGLDASISNTVEGIASNSAVTTALTLKVDSALAESVAARRTMDVSLLYLSGQLAANAAATGAVAAKLDSAVNADVASGKSLDVLGQRAGVVVIKFEEAVSELHSMVLQLSALDSALRGQTSELKGVADRIRDVKVAVEWPPYVNGGLATAGVAGGQAPPPGPQVPGLSGLPALGLERGVIFESSGPAPKPESYSRVLPAVGPSAREN